MDKIKVNRGYIGLNSTEAMELMDSLIEQGMLWEYITEIFNKSALEKERNKEESQTIKKLLEMMEGMQAKVSNIEHKVEEGITTKIIEKQVVAATTVDKLSVEEKPKVEEEVVPKRKKKKVDTSKLLKGNSTFMAMAGAMNKFK